MSNFWNGKKVLVTGAGGFIGSHLVEELIQKNAKVKSFVTYKSYETQENLQFLPPDMLKEIEIHRGDITDIKSCVEAVKTCDIVFHLAALVGIPYSYRSPLRYIDVNIKGTAHLLDASLKENIEKFIHTSTSEVYGTAQYIPIDEKHPLQPQSPYSASKIAADNFVLSYYYSFDLPVTILRPFNTFGPRQSARAIIPTIISQMYSGKENITLGDLTPTRDFNFVKNTVDAFIKLAETQKVEGEIFNAGSGREISIKDLIELIIKITGKKVKISKDKNRLRPKHSEVKRLVANADKLKQRCNWAPKITLEKGLEITCKWIEKNIDCFEPFKYSI
ncbi:MAG: SDR family NAD(P)-dependent oxidoreductase [Euryarchaeota archaeon]|nr:SDR family NAD(P)-dependent oxidoreductase [Euryarchaeota archaeon]